MFTSTVKKLTKLTIRNSETAIVHFFCVCIYKAEEKQICKFLLEFQRFNLYVAFNQIGVVELLIGL